MTTNAEEIWEVFCDELTQEPTDDMKEALSTAIRKIAEPLYGDGTFRNEIADELNELADMLEGLE